MPKVGIDPGHGGIDPGAIGPTGLKEKDVNLPVALELGRILEKHGFDVVYTRKTDTSLVEKTSDMTGTEWQKLELNAREKILDDAKCDVAISIHCNASANPRADYIATFIIARGGKAETLAIIVQRYLVEVTGWEDAGVMTKNLHMVRDTDMPAILPEMGFISNPDQEEWLREEMNQKKLAYAIGRGVCEYFGVGYKEPKPKGDKKLKLVFQEVVEVDAKLEDDEYFISVREFFEKMGKKVHFDKKTPNTVYIIERQKKPP